MLASSGGGTDQLALGGLLVAVTALLLIAYYVEVPYPIVLVVGGLGLGFVPGVPQVQLEPDVVLVLFLPPLLYGAAFFSSLRDLRANLQPVASLSIGLVVATMLVVGVVAHAAIDDLSWAAAFTLGAVLAPTDPVAATAIAGRLGAPKRFVTVVEGESLINDASALILFKFAVAAVVAGSFSLPAAVGEFLLSSAGGIAIGIGVAAVIAKVRKPLDDPLTEISISLLSPFLAYLPANAVGTSGVLAAVTAGIWLGWRAPVLVTPETRLQSTAVWEVLMFVLNAALFILLGTQLPGIVDGVSDQYSMATFIGWAALLTFTVVAVRFAWVIPRAIFDRVLRNQARELKNPVAPWGETFLVAFTGMRGAVSLAAALAIPQVTDAGEPFPGRDLIILVVYLVILFTIVGEGLALGPIIRRLGLSDASTHEAKEAKARLKAAMAAIDRLDELGSEAWVGQDSAARLKATYEFRVRRFKARFDEDDDGVIEDRSQAYQRLRREALEAERRELIRLRDIGFIHSDVLHKIERDLDLEDLRLDRRD
ncbi:MAG: Na+/H+ antiporter [Solirubrobacteraceae bacterium]|nr:Na+/H+ antiporter [Solirubrobacteraceae bacterium]